MKSWMIALLFLLVVIVMGAVVCVSIKSSCNVNKKKIYTGTFPTNVENSTKVSFESSPYESENYYYEIKVPGLDISNVPVVHFYHSISNDPDELTDVFGEGALWVEDDDFLIRNGGVWVNHAELDGDDAEEYEKGIQLILTGDYKLILEY